MPDSSALTTHLMPDKMPLSEGDNRLIAQATAIVEAHLADAAFSVEYFSEEMNLSRSALYKKLMSETGQAPLEFMRTIKKSGAFCLVKRAIWRCHPAYFIA